MDWVAMLFNFQIFSKESDCLLTYCLNLGTMDYMDVLCTPQLFEQWTVWMPYLPLTL
jgi:hypothetical protein